MALALTPEAVAFSVITDVRSGGRGLPTLTGQVFLPRALNRAVLKFKREVSAVELICLNEGSAALADRLAGHDKPGAVEQLAH